MSVGSVIRRESPIRSIDARSDPENRGLGLASREIENHRTATWGLMRRTDMNRRILASILTLLILTASAAQAGRIQGTWSTGSSDLKNGPWLETYGSGGPGSPGTLATGGVLMAIAEDAVPWQVGLFGQWRIGSFVCQGVSGGTGTAADPYLTYYSGGDMDLRAGENSLWGDGAHVESLTALNKTWYTAPATTGDPILNFDFSFQALEGNTLWTVNATWSGVPMQFGVFPPYCLYGGHTSADGATLAALVLPGQFPDFDSPMYTAMELTITAECIPEPSTMILFGMCLIGLAGLGRRRFRR